MSPGSRLEDDEDVMKFELVISHLVFFLVHSSLRNTSHLLSLLSIIYAHIPTSLPPYHHHHPAHHQLILACPSPTLHYSSYHSS